MPTKKIKPIEEVTAEAIEEVEEPVAEPTIESEEKVAFRELIAKYAQQNPVKYAEKKERLEAKLNQMK